MNYLVAQLGARRHYAIPRMLNQAGMLSHFYTDICAVKGWPRYLNLLPNQFRSSGIKRLLGRVPTGVPEDKITSFTSLGWRYHKQRSAIKTATESTLINLSVAKKFCESVIQAGFKDADGVYTFNSGGFELMLEAKKRGLKVVMEQTIAPREIEMNLLKDEWERFPDWEPVISIDEALDLFVAREHAEWDLADVILCGSEFVRDGIIASGGSADKCRIVPYGVDTKFFIKQRKRKPGPLRVLTVGAVGLRKGSPYVIAAAKLLSGKVEFRMVGSVNTLPLTQAGINESVELLGSVPRSEISRHFAWADVFLLPSLCEGSAMVVYEALAAGLPVICTPNTGSVVRHGIDGFIVPLRDTEAIVNALNFFLNDESALNDMSLNAKDRVKEFSLDNYKDRLVAGIV